MLILKVDPLLGCCITLLGPIDPPAGDVILRLRTVGCSCGDKITVRLPALCERCRVRSRDVAALSMYDKSITNEITVVI